MKSRMVFTNIVISVQSIKEEGWILEEDPEMQNVFQYCWYSENCPSIGIILELTKEFVVYA